MKLKKSFLVLTTLFILLGSNLALAVSDTTIPSGEESGEISGDIVPNESGEVPESGDLTPDESGEIISGDIPSGEIVSGDVTSGEFVDVLESTALDSNFETNKNTVLEGYMEASASGEETFNFIIVTEPSNGTVSHEDISTPSFSYTPEEDFVGEDSFTFRLESGDLYSNIGTITITVEDTTSEPIIPFWYTDMQEHWANYSAAHLAARGLIIGEQIDGDFYYNPNKTMTRGEFLTFLLSVVPVEEEVDTEEITFADEENIPNWLLEKAKIAYGMKIINGIGSNDAIYLYPEKEITRAEAFVMINNALDAATEMTDSSEAVEYTDKDDIPSWAKQAIQNLTSYKIIQGDTEKKIEATYFVDRGQAAELCYKLLKQIEASQMTPSEDLK